MNTVRCALIAAAVFALPLAHADDAKKAKPDDSVARYTQDIIDAMDADKNHEVSKKEFLDFMSREFDRLDVNHDGKLQQSEILDKPVIGQQKSSVSHR
jgi:Ca2+-binding EF-hand superfamily protein